MQTATWLTSRELAEAAGRWDIRLLSDDDGEYFCRVLLASDGVRFVSGPKVLYRLTPSSRLSHVGMSDKKKYALLLSMQLHIRYIRSLEESERVRLACVTYLQNWLLWFYPESPDLVAELEKLAESLGYKLNPPELSWKYSWMKPLLGWGAAKRAQILLPQIKSSMMRSWDKTMYGLTGAITERFLDCGNRQDGATSVDQHLLRRLLEFAVQGIRSGGNMIVVSAFRLMDFAMQAVGQAAFCADIKHFDTDG